jgi:hypothetical protein
MFQLKGLNLHLNSFCYESNFYKFYLQLYEFLIFSRNLVFSLNHHACFSLLGLILISPFADFENSEGYILAIPI